MKKTMLILMMALIFGACKQEARYTMQAPEIDSVKALLAASASGDYEGQRPFYAENAQIFINATKENPITVDQMIEGQKSEMGDFSQISVTVEDDAIEMVTTDNGEKWVNCWGTWKATHTASGKSFEIPFHETFQFVDGKIVKDHGYWDNSTIMSAMMEYEAAQKAAADTVPAM